MLNEYDVSFCSKKLIYLYELNCILLSILSIILITIVFIIMKQNIRDTKYQPACKLHKHFSNFLSEVCKFVYDGSVDTNTSTSEVWRGHWEATKAGWQLARRVTWLTHPSSTAAAVAVPGARIQFTNLYPVIVSASVCAPIRKLFFIINNLRSTCSWY